MKNKRIIIIVALTVTILAVAGTIAGAMYRDKDIVLSKNVSKDIQAEESEINSIIDEGKGLLEQKKYNDAKISFEKAISKEITRIETYTTIIDIYKEKTRYDDAYYFLKLSKTNNLEIKDYSKLEEEIKSRFEVYEIPVVLYVGDKYELPKEITTKINNEAANVQVQWENTTLDLSKEGNIKVKGIIKNYEREAVLNIEIKGLMTKEEGKEIIDNLYKNEKIRRQYEFDREIIVNGRIMYVYKIDYNTVIYNNQEDVLPEGNSRPAIDIKTRKVYREYVDGSVVDENQNIIGVSEVTPEDIAKKSIEEKNEKRKTYGPKEAMVNTIWNMKNGEREFWFNIHTNVYKNLNQYPTIYINENGNLTKYEFKSIEDGKWDVLDKSFSNKNMAKVICKDKDGNQISFICIPDNQNSTVTIFQESKDGYELFGYGTSSF